MRWGKVRNIKNSTVNMHSPSILIWLTCETQKRCSITQIAISQFYYLFVCFLYLTISSEKKFNKKVEYLMRTCQLIDKSSTFQSHQIFSLIKFSYTWSQVKYIIFTYYFSWVNFTLEYLLLAILHYISLKIGFHNYCNKFQISDRALTVRTVI